MCWGVWDVDLLIGASHTYQDAMQLVKVHVLGNDGHPPVEVGRALRLEVELELLVDKTVAQCLGTHTATTAYVQKGRGDEKHGAVVFVVSVSHIVLWEPQRHRTVGGGDDHRLASLQQVALLAVDHQLHVRLDGRRHARDAWGWAEVITARIGYWVLLTTHRPSSQTG